MPGRLHIHRALGFLAIVGLFIGSACRGEEIVPEPYLPSSAYDAYSHSLVETNLASTALGRDWIDSGERALSAPVEVSSPFEETGYFDAALPAAVGYRFVVLAGQRIEASVQVDSSEPVRIFLDLYRVPEEDGQGPLHVASSPARDPRLQFEPRRHADYLLRVQPELLRGGRFTLTIRNVAAFEFPVSGHDSAAIQSVYGAPREAGQRTHRGVDIFAPRGTPVVAAADATVSRVGTQRRGGNVIWLRTIEQRYSLYYAHLNSQSVERGQQVRAGDVIGTVGNTGNAHTTPPHLHFGVYVRGSGSRDPYSFIHQPRTTPSPTTVDLQQLGGWSRVTRQNTALRSAPARQAPVVRDLELHTPMRVWAATSRYFRVQLPDGSAGYVTGSLIEPAQEPLRSQALEVVGEVLDRPTFDASLVEQLAAGQKVPVLGSFGEFLWVQTPNGLTGWLSLD